MSNLVDNVYKIHNNPFVLTPLIIEFFKHSKQEPKDILLAYLVLPLVLYEKSQHSLVFARSTSSTHTFTRKKENLFGLPERVERYKGITNQCLQYALDNKIIKINEDLSVEVIEKNIVSIKSLKRALKASENLHKIFRDLDVVAIYRLLGVKGI